MRSWVLLYSLDELLKSRKPLADLNDATHTNHVSRAKMYDYADGKKGAMVGFLETFNCVTRLSPTLNSVTTKTNMTLLEKASTVTARFSFAGKSDSLLQEIQTIAISKSGVFKTAPRITIRPKMILGKMFRVVRIQEL